LYPIIYKENNLNDVIQKAETWWQKNCLYLGPKSRSAFYACLIFGGSHANMLKARTPGYDDRKEIRESWDTIMLPGKTLVEEMELPSINEDEFLKRKDEETQ